MSIKSFIGFPENIEKIFADDIREKKRTGRGVFSMRGKGVKHGFSGALKTPYHYMTNKEKKKLNGEVKVYQMYETVIPYEELQTKDEETQRTLLTKWREKFTNDEILEELKCGKKAFYDLMQELNVPKKRRGGSIKGQRKRKDEKNTAAIPEISLKHQQKDFGWLDNSDKEDRNVTNLDIIVEGLIKDIKELKTGLEEKEEQSIVTEGLHFEYNGAYDTEALNKLFTKLQLLIDGDTNKYHIKLSLSEIIEK